MVTDDSASKSAIRILQAPDGYYTYLKIEKLPASTHRSLLSKSDGDAGGQLDKTKIEKNYRKLSLKLHPDRPGGNAETFRMLERAKCVLMSDKLRKEYDLLGLDLEEEDEHQHDDGDDNGGGEDEKKADASSNPDSVISHMASATVAVILQLAIRTGMCTHLQL